MSKPILGLILGGILGVFDGFGALVSAGDDPEIRAGIVGIVIGSTFKGIIAGVAAGFFSRKFNSLPLGILFGLFVGAVLATIVAVLQGKYYLEIILPGSLLGAIVGFATQKYGRFPGGSSRSAAAN